MIRKNTILVSLTMLLLLCMGSTFAQVESLNEITSDIDTTVRKATFNGYPYLFYTPETKLAFGAGGILIFYTGNDAHLKPSKTSFGGYYSTNKQYRISMNNTFYFLQNKLYFNLPMQYGYYVDKFWGAGDDTESFGTESYTKKVFATSLNVQIPPEWFISDRTGIILDYQKTTIVDKKENTHIQTDSITGEGIVGANGGSVFGIGGDLLWDSRDNVFFPNDGGYQYFKIVVYPGITGETFSLLELDVRHYRAFKPDRVLAANVFVSSASGDVPFYLLPGIGGKKMRGLYEGRYRDNFAMLLQLEYRHMFARRLGFAVFGGAGNVAEEMLKYDFGNLKYNYGAGFRFRFNEEEKVNLRVDVGFAGPGNNMGIYFGIEEAF